MAIDSLQVFETHDMGRYWEQMPEVQSEASLCASVTIQLVVDESSGSPSSPWTFTAVRLDAHIGSGIATQAKEKPLTTSERVRFPVMFQSWNAMTFLHWPCDVKTLQRYLPTGLEVDAFDGVGWIGLTPFLLSGLRLPFAPACPWLSTFPETNLRTYVRGPVGPGVWFFSLDAARLAAVWGARATYGLPYHWADMHVRMDGQRVDYFSNRGGRANARIIVNVGGVAAQPGELIEFLTARFRLYSLKRRRLAYANVDHPPWRLHSAELLHFEESIRQAAGLPSSEEFPLTHHSPGVDVRIGRLRFI